MNAIETFHLNKLKSDLSIQRSLNDCKPIPQIYGSQCPQCGQKNFRKIGTYNNKQRYRCRNCKRTFMEQPTLECKCEIPGERAECQTCPQYQQFLASVKKNLEDFQNLSLEDLKSIQEQEGIT